ncbi:alpha carbonic anhydrase [Chytridium lagenaria]|nr:alpha carbonic anhydrase [Chytridium lagenaria]
MKLVSIASFLVASLAVALTHAAPSPAPMPAPNCLADVIHSHNLERRHLMRRQEDFSYEGKTGPEHWGDFNITCQTGHRQSPVNFDSDFYKAPDYSRPDISAWPKTLAGPLKYVNVRGHTVQVNIPDESKKLFATRQLDGRTYYLQQFHFHIPSEHHVYGKFYPGEIHFVHASDDGRLSVVGFFLKHAFESDSFFGHILPELPTEQTPLTITNLNFAPIIEAAKDTTGFWTYEGSLTVPPALRESSGPSPRTQSQPTQNNSFVEEKFLAKGVEKH